MAELDRRLLRRMNRPVPFTLIIRDRTQLESAAVKIPCLQNSILPWIEHVQDHRLFIGPKPIPADRRRP